MEVVDLPERRFCVRRHHGPVETVDETRRPMYQHMISHELVGGASALRLVEDDDLLRQVDVLIGATCNFRGDGMVRVEVLPAGPHAVQEWEGPEQALPDGRAGFLADVAARGHRACGPLLQVHLMDAIDGVTEQRFEVPILPASARMSADRPLARGPKV